MSLYLSGKYYDGRFRNILMGSAEGVPIADAVPFGDIVRMSGTGSRQGKGPRRENEKPSLRCAVCNRRYQPIHTPGMHTIYSICPDCRLTESRGAQKA
jgi:hypothetical protein